MPDNRRQPDQGGRSTRSLPAIPNALRSEEGIQVKFGVFLPSFIQGEPPDRHAQRLRDFARHAEELGFDSLWITDHIVTAHRFYSVSWLDSLMTLSHAAAITERVRLGTSILILPVRTPAILAKEIATLEYLSANRYIYGIGTGWYGPEFEACGG